MRKQRFLLATTIAASLFGMANTSQAVVKIWTGAASNVLDFGSASPPSNWVDETSVDTTLLNNRTDNIYFNQGSGGVGTGAPADMVTPNLGTLIQYRSVDCFNPAAKPITISGTDTIAIGNQSGNGFINLNSDGDVTFQNSVLRFNAGIDGIRAIGNGTVSGSITINTTSFILAQGGSGTGSGGLRTYLETALAGIAGGNITINPTVDYSLTTVTAAGGPTLFLNTYQGHTITLNNGITGHATRTTSLVVNGDAGAFNDPTVANQLGTVTINGTSAFIGNTTVANGTLILTGTHNDSGVTTINSGATLQIGNGGTAGGIGGTDTSIVNDGALKFNHSATLASPLVFANAISGTGGLTNNAGVTNLTGNNTYSGNTTVSAGTLNITGSHTTGANYSVATGAVLVTNNVRVTNALTVDGTATINADGTAIGASKVETLTIGAGGKLNLKDNDLVVGTAPNFNAVRTAIIAGKTNNAAAGITSDVTGFGVSRGFGYAMGNDPKVSSLLAGSLAGQTFDTDSVLVKFTLLGDADLDGDTDLNDLGLWSNGYTGDLGANPPAPTTFWTGGDFDYDGDTDLNDLGLWSSTYTGDFNGGPGSLVVNAPGASPEAVAILNSMGFTVVPEPSTFVLAGVGLAGLVIASRRRKR